LLAGLVRHAEDLNLQGALARTIELSKNHGLQLADGQFAVGVGQG
jgi:hypothetical protein